MPKLTSYELLWDGPTLNVECIIYQQKNKNDNIHKNEVQQIR